METSAPLFGKKMTKRRSHTGTGALGTEHPGVLRPPVVSKGETAAKKELSAGGQRELKGTDANSTVPRAYLSQGEKSMSWTPGWLNL